MLKYKLKKEQEDSILDTVFKNRNLKISRVEELLKPSISNLESPFNFKNMKRGVKRLRDGIANKENIVIVVDSDADGYCSSAILYHFIKEQLKYDNIYYIIQEKPKAHGFNNYIINTILENDIDLVIMPDAGSSDIEAHKKMIQNNITVIILDHHEVDIEVNKDIILINCKEDKNVKNKDLSGAAVTYKFISAFTEAFNRDINPDIYLDMVSLSLVSDLVNMDNLENRLLHDFGRRKENTYNKFIKQFFLNDINKLTIENQGFEISPLINATVRYGTMEEKELLFTSLIHSNIMVKSKKRGSEGELVSIYKESKRIANNIKVRQNKDRDKAVKKIFDLIDSTRLDDKILIIDTKDISSPALNGLIANKIVEKYKKPVLMIRSSNGIYEGSARNLNNCEELKMFKDFCIGSNLFELCQGHQPAFGVKIKEDNLDKFKEYANDKLKDIELSSLYEVDAHYQNGAILQDVIDIGELDDLWCNSIPAPLFAVKGIRVHTSDIKKIGNATYTFRLDGITYTKNFGSKVFYENLIKKELLPLGGDIEIDIIAKFRKNIKGYAYVDIVNAESKIL